MFEGIAEMSLEREKNAACDINKEENSEEKNRGKNVPGGDRIVRTSHEGRRDFEEGGFWDFDRPKKKVYKKPEFSSESLGVAPVERVNIESGAVHEGEAIPKKGGAVAEAGGADSAVKAEVKADAEIKPNATIKSDVENKADEVPVIEDRCAPVFPLIGSGEKSKSGGSRVVRTVDGERAVPAYSYGSYSRRSVVSRTAQANAAKKQAQAKAVRKSQPREKQADIVYSPGGAFINKITVKEWVTDTDFYSRFAEDVEKSRNRVSRYPYTVDLPEVKFFSYVPQYAHMNRSQIEYYDWVKDCVSHGKYPMCDLSYLQLYVYELINLGGDENYADLITSILIEYRGKFMNKYPLFTGNLCEWLADYCMIRGLNAPSRLIPFLPEIVARSQIKEFYLDGIFHEYKNDEAKLYRTLAEVFIYSMSDYDYRSSRYYEGNKAAYDELIPGAVAAVLKSQLEDRRGIFGFGRIYRIVRDTYVGAVASIKTKKRMELELASCIRLESTRDILTKVIKYAENKVRQMYSLKSKLSAKLTDVRDIEVIDGYFAPMIAKAGVKVKVSAEDRFMPEGYMKNYEAEATGFDLSAAEAIERDSWVNTERLVLSEADVDSAKVEEAGGSVEAYGEEKAACDAVAGETLGGSKADDIIIGAVKAALGGKFRQYARECGVYEGELVDRVNSVFIDEIGDILIDGGGVIEDYREDALAWVERNE